MRKLIKWVGIISGGIVLLLVVAFTYIYIVTEARLNETYDVQVEQIELSEDISDIDRGFPKVMLGMCRDCHGPTFAGQIMEDDPLVGRLVAPNLTKGAGGLGDDFTTEDWVRALRHGVDEDGTSLIVMPSDLLTNLNDADLGYIIAFIQSVPPVDNQLPKIQLGPMGRFYVLQEPVLVAELIDHDGPRPPKPEPGVTVEYGEYLAKVCVVCHGEDYAGGEQVGAGLNLTPGGDLANWTEADFIQTFRTGITPEGKRLDPEMMPLPMISQFNDDELKALWLFLQSLPPVETQPTPEA